MSAVEGFRGVRDRIPESIVFGRDSYSLVEIIPPLSGRTSSTGFALILSSMRVRLRGWGGEVVEIYFPINYRVCAYGTLLFRYDLKISFSQVNNFAVALIINFSFQCIMVFLLKEVDAFFECTQNWF